MNIYEGIEDYEWLYLQTQLPVSEFVEIAQELEISNKDLDKFWKSVGTKLNEILESEFHSEKMSYHVEIPSGKRMTLDQWEYAYAKGVWGEPTVDNGLYKFSR